MRPVYAGEVYQEVDPRVMRWVKVLQVLNGAVTITTCDDRGIRENSNRQTIAKQERFNGKRGGYRYCFSIAKSEDSKHG